jgi:hypothetical protein
MRKGTTFFVFLLKKHDFSTNDYMSFCKPTDIKLYFPAGIQKEFSFINYPIRAVSFY